VVNLFDLDKNDNPPFFSQALYEAEVDENEDIQHTVLTVTAKDLDECKCNIFSYFIPEFAGERTFQKRSILSAFKYPY
jgi:hypothetical protein